MWRSALALALTMSIPLPVTSLSQDMLCGGVIDDGHRRHNQKKNKRKPQKFRGRNKK